MIYMICKRDSKEDIQVALGTAFSPFESARKMSLMLSAVLPRWLIACTKQEKGTRTGGFSPTP